MPSHEPLYVAARRVMDSGLGADDSAFTPGAAIWTAESLEDLHERFVLAPDTGGRRFLEKLEDQLKGAPAATVQLTAELLYLHLLAPVDMGGVAKRNLLRCCTWASPTRSNQSSLVSTRPRSSRRSPASFRSALTTRTATCTRSAASLKPSTAGRSASMNPPTSPNGGGVRPL
jgi:hypothetical protein